MIRKLLRSISVVLLAGVLPQLAHASSEWFSLSGQHVTGGNPIGADGRITQVTAPVLHVSPSKNGNIQGTVLLLPGGGYQILSAVEEGSSTAAKLNEFGYDVVTLEYHINAGAKTRDLALQDAVTAWRLLKAAPEKLGVHKGRAVLMGYSAGGHLAARVVQNLGDAANLQPDDIVLVYPAYLEETAPGSTTPIVQPPAPHSARLFILMGTNDNPNWQKGAQGYADAWLKGGGYAVFEPIKDAGHGFGIKPNLKGDVAQWPEMVKYFLENGPKPGVGPFNTCLPWFLKHNPERLESFAKSKPNEKRAIVFLGDSITEKWDLPKAFPGLKIANRGIGGDTTRGMLYRLKDNVLDLNPKAIVILAGINDLLQQPKGTPETITSNMHSILDQISKANPSTPVLLCETLPSKSVGDGEVAAVNAAVDKIALAYPNVHRVKTYASFLNRDGSINLSLYLDGTHPNPTGYEIWRSILRPELDHSSH